MTDSLRQQYGFVQGSRRVLLEYCNTIRPEDFINQNSSFGRGGSMRNLIVHIAQTYQHWIGNIALKKNIVFADYQDYASVSDVFGLFASVDALMEEFMANELLADRVIKTIEYDSNGAKRYVTPLQLFTHIITHEYHHKGQVLSISRHLGYIPVDTDVIR